MFPVVTPLTAVEDKDPPVIVAPFTELRPETFPPVINTFPADWVAIVPRPRSEGVYESMDLTVEIDKTSGAPDPPVFLPRNDEVAISAIFPSVTVLSAIVFKLVEPAQVERAVFSTKERPTWDLVRLVNNEPFNAGRYPDESSLTSWDTPLKVFPWVVTDEFNRAVLMVPVVAELMAVIADCPAESELASALAVVAEVAVVAELAFPVKAPVNVVAETDVNPVREPPVIDTLLAFWVAIVPSPETSEELMPNIVLTCDPVKAIGVAALPVLFPIIELAARLAILPKVTAPLPIAVVIEVAPDPVISPLSAIDWLAVKYPELFVHCEILPETKLEVVNPDILIFACPAGESVTRNSLPLKFKAVAPDVTTVPSFITSALPPPPPESAAQYQFLEFEFHLRICPLLQLVKSEIPLAVASKPPPEIVCKAKPTDPDAPPPTKPFPAVTAVIVPPPPAPQLSHLNCPAPES